ncbi:MAG: NAD(P)H-dependent oxidoreductase subunit E [Nitrospirota bacterium]
MVIYNKPSRSGGFICRRSKLLARFENILQVLVNRNVKRQRMEETLQNILENYRKSEGNIVTILQDIERSFGYVPEDAVNWFSKKLDIPASRFFGVATFYSQFHLKPRGKNVITVCRGTACHVKGSERLINRLLIELDIPADEDTTNDQKFTIEKVNCIGACGIAPVAVVNHEVHGKMTLDKMMKEVKKLRTGD